ncbi:YchJ family protein [Paraglaciecola arctica]|nr:YchJ family protein [Paraglaciecola arctica]MBU3002715.1 YchJ family protein [Paraglaciecola arctica]
MTTTNKNCFCGNKVSFESCCQPIITGQVEAQTAEKLMRSRYSAYVIEDYAYILRTYAFEQRTDLTLNILADSAKDTRWLSLQVLKHLPNTTSAQVEFKAFYKIEQQYFVMHELSDFVMIDNIWLYTSGSILKDSGVFQPQRNSRCLCGSGRKFKKCCG